MLADSDRRHADGTAWPDCVITVLPDARAGPGPAEHRALRALAEAGLIRRRLVTHVTRALVHHEDRHTQSHDRGESRRSG